MPGGYPGRKTEREVMATYIEAPDWTLFKQLNPSGKSIFLAGGITGCPDWQQEMRTLLQDTNLTLLNPRRKDFPIDDPTAVEGQIKWEYNHLRAASAILFWFPKETICPIVLYELGAWSMTDKPIFVGVHPKYSRRQDVIIQTLLYRPEVMVRGSLAGLSNAVRRWHDG